MLVEMKHNMQNPGATAINGKAAINISGKGFL